MCCVGSLLLLAGCSSTEVITGSPPAERMLAVARDPFLVIVPDKTLAGLGIDMDGQRMGMDRETPEILMQNAVTPQYEGNQVLQAALPDECSLVIETDVEL
jgi:hypothetical protein